MTGDTPVPELRLHPANHHIARKEVKEMVSKIHKLNIEPAGSGINIDVDGATEGIHIEYKILPDFVEALVSEALDYHTVALHPAH
ncbi:hypothetical protein CIP107580_01828 [Corynebacterium diphtheriae]|nr:hypothetical protein CIP107533_01850 [Corynebacterium diphtheriae]CAB0661534.1 hypothetical protein CIP107580_01828 [Corynebacterium diphtheriae]